MCPQAKVSELLLGGNGNGGGGEELVAGDPSLELQVQTLNNLAVQDIPAGAWRSVRSWVIDGKGERAEALSPLFPLNRRPKPRVLSIRS